MLNIQYLISVDFLGEVDKQITLEQFADVFI